MADEEQRLKHNYMQTIIALKESLKLQIHYAELLNMHDGGRRRIFNTIDDWLDRLVETGIIKPLKKEEDD
jgi:hypothetical protein